MNPGFVALVALIVYGAIMYGVEHKQNDRIRDLEAQVACLKHPTHGASSTRIRKVGGKIVVTQPPTATVC